MAFGTGRDGKAGFQIALRLAPQRLHAAQLRQRQQQLGVARPGMQPFLGLFDLPRRAAAAHFAVQRHQFLVPVAVERSFQHVERAVVAVALHEGAGGGTRHPGIGLEIGRNFLPVFQQAAVVFGTAPEIFSIGHAAVLGGHAGFHGIAAHQRVEQAVDLVPLSGQLTRLEFEAQQRGVLRRDLLGPVDRHQRGRRVLGVEAGFGLKQLRSEFGAVFGGFLEMALALRRGAHFLGGAGGQHAGQPAPGVVALPLPQRQFGVLVAVFGIRPEAADEIFVALFRCAPLALFAHDARQIEGQQGQPQQHDAAHHQADRDQHKADEGDLHPPRRVHQHHITGIVAPGHRQRDGQHRDDEERDQPAHQ